MVVILRCCSNSLAKMKFCQLNYYVPRGWTYVEDSENVTPIPANSSVRVTYLLNEDARVNGNYNDYNLLSFLDS